MDVEHARGLRFAPPGFSGLGATGSSFQGIAEEVLASRFHERCHCFKIQMLETVLKARDWTARVGPEARVFLGFVLSPELGKATPRKRVLNHICACVEVSAQ